MVGSIKTRSRLQASQLRTSWWSWAAITLVFFCTYASAQDHHPVRPVSTREVLLKTLQNSSGHDCKTLIQASDSGSMTLSESSIEEKIYLHDLSKKENNRVQNDLMLQYATDIVVVSRSYVQSLAKNLTKTWIAAQNYEIQRAADGARNSAKAKATQGGSDTSYTPPYFYSLPVDRDVFPAIASVIADPSVFAKLREHSQSMLLTGEPPEKNSNGKINKRSGELGRFIGTRYPVKLSKEIEAGIRADLINLAMKDWSTLTQANGEAFSDTIEKELSRMAEYRSNVIKSWHAYMSLDASKYFAPWFESLHRELQNYVIDLSTRFPISENNKKWPDIQKILETISSLDPHNDPFSMLGPAYDRERQSLHLVERGAIVRYNPNLATMELVPAKDIGLAPVTHFIHGAGTNKSSGASARSLVGTYAGHGVKLHAIDHTDAATGIFVDGNLLETLAYTDKALRETKATLGQAINGVEPPLRLKGRSIGGTKVWLYNLFYPETIADQVVAISLSVPDTLSFQIENVHRQAAEGGINGVIDGALQHATEFSQWGMDAVRRAYEQDKIPFKLGGNKFVGFQGVSDEDARPMSPEQPEPVPALRTLMNRYMGLAHIIAIDDPLLKYAQRFTHARFDEIKEGAHFLESALENLTKAEVMRNPEYEAFRDIPEEDLPQLRNQLEFLFAHEVAHLDYLIDGLPNGIPWPDAGDRASQKKLKEYRERVAPGKTLLEHYIDRLNESNSWKQQRIHLTMNDVRAAEPGRKTKAQWFARVYRYWQERPHAVLKIYQDHGVLPK